MAFMKTNSVDITVDGQTYNSLTDFGLAIENTDYLDSPVQGTNGIVIVPGKSGPLDQVDDIFGEQWFSYRRIQIKFGGIEVPEEWDQRISLYRNLFEGKKVQLVFATDPDWYWTGRVKIDAFAHNRALGTFDFIIEQADPYKYKDITLTTTATSGGTTVTAAVTRKTVVPAVTCVSDITITYNGETFSFTSGTHKDLAFRLPAGNNSLVVKGSGSVTIAYSDGSL